MGLAYISVRKVTLFERFCGNTNEPTLIIPALLKKYFIAIIITSGLRF